MMPTAAPPHVDDKVLRAAWLYYRENLTQDSIAAALGVSRATVGRLLERARREGIVRVEIDPDLLGAVGIAASLSAKYERTEVLVVPADGVEHDQAEINARLARAAAQLLSGRLNPEDTLAIGWGDTVVKSVTQLPAGRQIVTLTGGVGSYPGALSARFGESLAMIPAPFLASTPERAEAFASEGSIERIMAQAVAAQWKLVGVGGLNPDASIVKFGYQTADDLHALEAAGSVGDILGLFYDINGEVFDLDIHRRRIGVDLDDLATAPGTLIAAAGGKDKRMAMLGALRGGFVDLLVTTEEDARAIAEYDDGLGDQERDG
ncbi:MAG: sugar-binding transcriptional regulator [bacterium]|nr:sugar-binding transcriptional regulator [bacterium]MCP4964493.1 sugar-binding transcriptional regulator [bacterium]